MNYGEFEEVNGIKMDNAAVKLTANDLALPAKELPSKVGLLTSTINCVKFKHFNNDVF